MNKPKYTFAKITCKIQGPFGYWMLLYDGGDEMTHEVRSYLNNSLEKSVVNGKALLDNSRKGYNDFFERVQYVNTHSGPDYKAVYLKHKNIGGGAKLLIKQNGSFFVIYPDSDLTITDIRTSDHLVWDDSNGATIAIIENDHNAEPDWLDYLSKRFPNQPYRLLNTFSLLDDETVKEMLKGIKTVTFMTTFTSLEWYEKLLRNIGPDKVDIIGYSSNNEKWEEVKEIELNGNRLEIVELNPR